MISGKKMALSINRAGDINNAGGAITAIPQTTVFANGLLVSINGATGTSHPPCGDSSIHCEGNWVTTGGSPTVFINNISVNRIGDVDSCGHTRVSGSPNVFVG